MAEEMLEGSPKKHKHKKHKRLDEEFSFSSFPSTKKVRFAENEEDNKVISNVDKPVGIVASFPNNRLRNWKSTRFSEHQRSCVASKNGVEKFYVMKSEVHNNVLHVGTAPVESPGYNHAILIRNKRTGELDFRSVSLYEFRPQWVADPAVFLGEKEAPKVDTTANFFEKLRGEGFLENKKLLVAEFGSAKKQKYFADQEKLGMKSEALGATESLAQSHMMSQTPTKSSEGSTDVGISPVQEEKLSLLNTAQRSSIVPECNMEAKRPADIYTFECVLPAEDMEYFSESVDAFLKKSLRMLHEQDYPMPLLAFVKALPTDPTERRRRAAVILFVANLMAILRVCTKFGVRKFTANGVKTSSNMHDDVVLEYLFNKYLTEIPAARRGNTTSLDHRQFEASLFLRDQLLARLLIPVLLLNGLTLNVTEWMKLLALPNRCITGVLKSLGCRVDTNKDAETSATLVGPPGSQAVKKFGSKGRK